MDRQSNNKKSLGLPNPEYGPNDVLLGRSSSCYNHPGNIRFRKIIEAQAYIYKNQSHYLYTRNEKASHVSFVIDILRGSRFLRYENGKWKQVGLRAVREKVGHALRDQSTQHSRQKAHELVKQNYECSGQTQDVKRLMAMQQPSALELRHLFSDNTSNNNILHVNKSNKNNPMTAAAGSLPTMIPITAAAGSPPTMINKGSFPLALPSSDPPAIGRLLGSLTGRAPLLTAAASLHQPAATGAALPDVLVNLTGTAASVGTLPASLSTVTASPATLPPTALQPETLVLLQQSVQQLGQVEHFYNNLRSNIETTVSLLRHVGESTSQQQQQLSQRHRELSQQLLLEQQQSTAVAVPNGNKKPWEDGQQPSLCIKVSKNKASTSRRRSNTINNTKKRRRQLGPDEVMSSSSKSNQAAEGVISLVSDGEDAAMLEMISSALGQAFGRW